MKKSIITSAAILLMASCTPSTKSLVDLASAEAQMEERLSKIETDSTLSAQEVIAQYYDVLKETYLEHQEDSLGIKTFRGLISMSVDAGKSEEIVELYEKSQPIVHDNERIKCGLKALENLEQTSPGCTYKDLCYPDAISGDPLSISSILSQGKPVLVDFWASWCPPCRQEIKNHLLQLAQTGKVNIVGIAVWEECIDNTRKAMNELGITWPVMYTGGRENSPSIEYGVTGIPTLILISPEGTILGKGHSIEEIEAMKDLQ